MKLGPVTKLEERNKNGMLANWDVIAIFPIFDQLGAIGKLDSGRIVSESYIFINSELLAYKNWKQD